MQEKNSWRKYSVSESESDARVLLNWTRIKEVLVVFLLKALKNSQLKYFFRTLKSYFSDLVLDLYTWPIHVLVGSSKNPGDYISHNTTPSCPSLDLLNSHLFLLPQLQFVMQAYDQPFSNSRLKLR